MRSLKVWADKCVFCNFCVKEQKGKYQNIVGGVPLKR